LETLSDRYTRESIEFIENSQKINQQFLLVVSWNHVHTALVTSKQFRGKSNHGRYGDAVEEMDYGTGQIISSLDRLGLAGDTLVYFTKFKLQLNCKCKLILCTFQVNLVLLDTNI
jgi:arylsulfatase A-like enzyme